VKAYVLIKTVDGSRSVAAALRGMPGIELTDEVTGAFDAIALATAGSVSDLLERVVSKIRELPGVLHALPAPLNGSLSPVAASSEAA
jgi:DNA-binding Lrp family transcriptional regulator